MARRRVHLDTNILMAAIGFEDVADLKDRARRLLFPSAPQQACASMPAIGELVTIMTERDEQGDGYVRSLERLREYIQDGRLRVSWVRDYEHGLGTPTRLAGEAQAVDAHLDDTDSLIIACAMADPNADVLYSTDEFVGRIPLGTFARRHGTSLRSLD